MAGKKIAILGSTGSIGRNALKVINANPQYYAVCALTAASSLEALAAQAKAHPDACLHVPGESQAEALKNSLPVHFSHKIFWGDDGLQQLLTACQADLALNAISGAAGLASTMAILRAGVNLALANKESLVMGGKLVTSLAREKRVNILPVDSEHSAIWQIWPDKREHISNIWLTASGGPFLNHSASEMRSITPAMALSHPKWSMGPKISIDSATLMNKGLEVIEAALLFDFAIDNIKVVIHPQSLVHGMLEMVDGSILAQIGPTDMQLPIALAFAHPKRLPSTWPLLNILQLGRLDFIEPDVERFPALKLAIDAGRAGGSMPTVLNAANEVAIEAFLLHGLPFVEIAVCVDAVLQKTPDNRADSIDEVLQADKAARDLALAWLRNRRN